MTAELETTAMLTGRDLVVLSDRWDGLPTSTMHLFRRLEPYNRVFWLNIITRMPRWNWQDARKLGETAWTWTTQWARGARWRRAVGSTGPLLVRSPLMIPWFRPLVRRLNAAFLTSMYRRLVRRYRIADPVIVATFPCVADFLRNVDAALKIYYCVDDWTQYPGLHGPTWAAMEQDILGTVDGVVATSRDLQRKCRASIPSLYLPHGVDYAHFHAAATAGRRIPEMEHIRGPIVGFFGIIAEWIDLELVAALSRSFPEVSFVLIGPASVRLRIFHDCPNVHCLGAKPYAELPAFARYFDYGLIPFRRTVLTAAVNPVKLLEYFALGLPVLATRLPELESVDGPLWLAEGEAEFRGQLRAMLSDGCADSGETATAVAAENGWDGRVAQLARFLAEVKSDTATTAEFLASPQGVGQ